MAKFKITIDGVDSTIRRKLTDAKARNELDAIIMTSINNLGQKAAQRAPVDTGRLRNSLMAYIEKRGEMNWVMKEGTEYTVYQEYNNPNGKQAFIRTSLYEEVENLKRELHMWKRKKTR